MPTVSAQRLAEVFVEVADTLVDEFDVTEFLQLLSVRTAELLDAAAVGVLLADPPDPPGPPRFVAASEEKARLLELFELQHREGPGLDAFLSGTAIFAPDLRADRERWPRFVPQALAAGFGSVHAVPMRLRSDVIGALNLFGRRAGALDADDVRIVQALVDVATIALLQERTIRQREVLAEQLQGALNSRVVIEQAKGALAQIHRVSVDEAFALMRNYARRNGRRLSEVAQTVVSDDRSGITALIGE